MPPSDRPQLREAIRRTLAHRAGSAPDAVAVAGAAVSVWQQVSEQLAPVIGDRGVEALFTRSLSLTSTAFPWLPAASDPAAGGTPMAHFRARLEAHDAVAAAAASHALLVTFTELLASLIGEALTERRLAPVWAPRTQR